MMHGQNNIKNCSSSLSNAFSQISLVYAFVFTMFKTIGRES